MKKVFSSPTATLEQAQDIEKYLEYVHGNGQSTGIISPGHLDRIAVVLKHVRLRMARGEFKPKGLSNGEPNGSAGVIGLWNQVNPEQPITADRSDDPNSGVEQLAVDPGSVDYDYDAAEKQAYDPNYDPDQS
jgi:hypothetical protein